MLEIKILWAGAILFGGWFVFFIFGRQFIFNLFVAFPLINKMNSIHEGLISINSKRLTAISLIVCTVFLSIIFFVVIRFCPLYLLICFFVGFLSAAVMFLGKITPSNKSFFESFCYTYYKFVPDDELRTVMFNREINKIKLRLRDMGFSETFVPDFKK